MILNLISQPVAVGRGMGGKLKLRLGGAPCAHARRSRATLPAIAPTTHTVPQGRKSGEWVRRCRRRLKTVH